MKFVSMQLSPTEPPSPLFWGSNLTQLSTGCKISFVGCFKIFFKFEKKKIIRRMYGSEWDKFLMYWCREDTWNMDLVYLRKYGG